MKEFEKECIELNCPIACGEGFTLSKEGFEDFKNWYKKCPYASNCSYIDSLITLFDEELFIILHEELEKEEKNEKNRME